VRGVPAPGAAPAQSGRARAHHEQRRFPAMALPERASLSMSGSKTSPSWAGVSSISRDTCKASAETRTNVRRDAFVVLQPSQHRQIGSGAGIRTLNLAVNRSPRPVQKWSAVFAECHRLPPINTVCRRRCCTAGLSSVGDASTPDDFKTAETPHNSPWPDRLMRDGRNPSPIIATPRWR